MGNVKKEGVPSQKETVEPVDKIRELLFGSQMENYDQHFKRLETMIFAETKAATDDMVKRLAAVELSLIQRLDKADQAQLREQKERMSAISSTNEALQQAFNQLNERLAVFESETDRHIADIKDTIEYESRNLGSQIKALHDELSQTLNDEANRLDRQKVNRQQLADLLAGLSNELHRS